MSDCEMGFFFLTAFVIAFGYMVFTPYSCEYTDVLERGPKGGEQKDVRCKFEVVKAIYP